MKRYKKRKKEAWKKQLAAGLVCVMFLLTACTGTKPAAREDNLETDQGSTVSWEEQSSDRIEEVEQGRTELTVYYGNENADAILSEHITADSVTCGLILDQLKQKQVLPENVRINSLHKEDREDEQALKLDLSEEFLEYLSTLGTAGEYVVLGGVVNTFLDAYDAECIRITANGKALETPHELYDGYLYFYPLD